MSNLLATIADSLRNHIAAPVVEEALDEHRAQAQRQRQSDADRAAEQLVAALQQALDSRQPYDESAVLRQVEWGTSGIMDIVQHPKVSSFLLRNYRQLVVLAANRNI